MSTKDIITRLQFSLRTHGPSKAIRRGLRLGRIYLLHGLKKFLYRKEYKLQWSELEEKISSHHGLINIIHQPMGWNTPAFQRYQQLTLESARAGHLAIYGGHPTVDTEIFVFQEVRENLLVFNAKDREITEKILKTLEKQINRCAIRIQSIDLVTTTKEVKLFVEKGFKVIYEYIDEISDEITGNVPDFVYQRHEMILKDERVTVVATSDQLFENVQKFRSTNMILSTNGVDLKHWHFPPKVPPQDLLPALTGRIIIGYHGALAKWIDYDLLLAIADQEIYELVLIGYEHDKEFERSGLKKHPRVHFLGNKSYFDLNSYAAHYDVAILPFRKNTLTEAVSPIKIFEYMAAAKPIVTTDLRECKKYKSCLIASNTNEFLLQLTHAIALKNNAAYLDTLNMEARKNSWYEKTMEVLKITGIAQIQREFED